MANTTQQEIDTLIQFINDAEDPGTVTNVIVATVLGYLASKINSAASANDLTQLQNTLNTLMSGDATEAIESFQEVISFLEGVTDDTTLTGLLAAINARLTSAETALEGKASLDGDTGAIDYTNVPAFMLNSMGSTLDNADSPSSQRMYVPSAGDWEFLPGTSKIRFHITALTYVDKDPDRRVIYGNKYTGYLYQWKNNQMQQVGGGALPITIANASPADFEIADENGNVLVRFENGHIKTENFDSSSIPAYAVDQALAANSTNPVENRVVTNALGSKADSVTTYTKTQVDNIVVAGQAPLKVLVIGNSYSCDSFGLVPFILKNYGIDIMIGIAYKGGASISQHVSYYNTANAYWYYSINTGNGDTSWAKQTNVKLHDKVIAVDWDIIVMQESHAASTTSETSETPAPFSEVPTLIGKILDDMSKPVMFGWNINHTAYECDQQTRVLDNCKATIDANPIDIVFPYGTAVFDGRTNQTLAAIGDGGNLWNSDKLHLQEGLPVYLANLANVQALFKKFYPRFCVMGDTFVPTVAYRFGDIQDHGEITGVTDANRRLAQKCAVMANKFNFDIKNIS